jgi:phosphoribosylformylglycinamidine (FGAM) synthase PurS component
MRTPKQIAIDITKGDKKAKQELEKMMGKSFEEMTIEEMRLGVTCLSAFEKQWNN